MPPKGGSRRSRAGKANYAKRECNEFNELCPGPLTTTKKAAIETTEAPESADPACDPVIQIAQAVRVLASQDLDGRDKRAVVKEIGLQLMVVNGVLTQALESAQKNQELEENLIAKIVALPPALSREQQCALAVLDEVNAGRDAPLSTYLIKERLLTDHKKKLTEKKRTIRALEEQLVLRAIRHRCRP